MYVGKVIQCFETIVQETENVKIVKIKLLNEKGFYFKLLTQHTIHTIVYIHNLFCTYVYMMYILYNAYTTKRTKRRFERASIFTPTGIGIRSCKVF